MPPIGPFEVPGFAKQPHVGFVNDGRSLMGGWGPVTGDMSPGQFSKFKVEPIEQLPCGLAVSLRNAIQQRGRVGGGERALSLFRVGHAVGPHVQSFPRCDATNDYVKIQFIYRASHWEVDLA